MELHPEVRIQRDRELITTSYASAAMLSNNNNQQIDVL